MEISSDWGNIIFILIAVVGGIFSMIGENKKRKEKEKERQRKAQETYPDEKSLWEELQKEFGHPEAEPIKEEAVEHPAANTSISRKIISKSSTPFIPANMEIKGASIKTNPMMLQESEEDRGTGISIDLKDPEEIKKAIIYNEILRPKYIDDNKFL